MPILPLDYPEPFAATLGVMLYPGTEGTDPLHARAFAAQYLAKPLQRFHEAGHTLPYESLARIQEDAGELITDLDKRWWGGIATGNIFKTFFVLARTHEALASWNNAVRVFELAASRARSSGSRSQLWKERTRFLSVAHLWGAWSIRDGKFETRPEIAYDGYHDFQSFLTESEDLRYWGQTWRPPRAKSEPPLPPDVWRVPDDWSPPNRQPGWPNTGMIPRMTLPADLLAGLKPAGRPRERG
jgi:hypothetical protein